MEIARRSVDDATLVVQESCSIDGVVRRSTEEGADIKDEMAVGEKPRVAPGRLGDGEHDRGTKQKQ